MKVIFSIKVHRDNLQQLQKLRYLARVDVGEDGKSITVQIKDNCTRGSLTRDQANTRHAPSAIAITAEIRVL